MRKRCGWVPVLLSVLAVQGAAGQESVQELATAAGRAAATGDHAGYTRAIERALALAPQHPYLLYHHARALALAGHSEEALAALERAGLAGIGLDPAADSAFAALHPGPAFRALRERTLARAAALVASDTAFVLPNDGLIPENLAPDPRTGGFFIGDLLGGRVLHRAPDGAVRVFAGPEVLRGSVVGMKTDTARALLWVNVRADSTTMPPAQFRTTARSALLALDLAAGDVRYRHVPADSFAPHLFNDLVLTRSGSALLTDSDAGVVYRLRAPGDTLEVWLRPAAHTFSYPNGIALDRAERTLYVAHLEGVSAIDVDTRERRLLHAPAGFTLTGFDGLYASGEGFVGIQNGGLGLPRVVAFTIAADGSVSRVQELERRHPAYRTPTTGALHDGALYYIANAQLDRLNARDWTDAARPLEPIIVLRLPLPAALR